MPTPFTLTLRGFGVLTGGSHDSQTTCLSVLTRWISFFCAVGYVTRIELRRGLRALPDGYPGLVRLSLGANRPGRGSLCMVTRNPTVSGQPMERQSANRATYPQGCIAGKNLLHAENLIRTGLVLLPFPIYNVMKFSFAENLSAFLDLICFY